MLKFNNMERALTCPACFQAPVKLVCRPCNYVSLCMGCYQRYYCTVGRLVRAGSRESATRSAAPCAAQSASIRGKSRWVPSDGGEGGGGSAGEGRHKS